MAKKTNESERELGIGKILFIIFSVFVITPLIILSIIYYTNDDFKMSANKYLADLPGPAGDYFKAYPTKKEIDSQKIDIAKYLVEIDNNRATDKLILIKNEDEVLYNEIIKIMLKLKPNKTKSIVEDIRKNLIKKDILARTVEQIDEEKKKETLDKAKYYESLSMITAINEIESLLNQEEITYSKLASYFENMQNERSAYLLKYLDDGIREKIIDNFDYDEKKREMKVLLNTINDNELKLKNLAEIYSTENPEKLVNIIGNTETYNIDDLALIYRSLGVTEAARILSKLDDESFVHDLVNAIKEKEILINDNDLITEDILKAYKIYRDFDNNVTELTSTYEKLGDEQIAELIKGMIGNSISSKKYLLDNGEVISISDEDLALSILKKFNKRKLASVLDNFDTNLASEVTKKLSMPNL